MGNFMSCVLICGAMEVVQVVNTNGRVEKLIRPIRAAELIWAHERYKAALAAGLTPSSVFEKSPSPATPEKSNSNKKMTSPSQSSLPPATKPAEDSNNNKFVLLPLDPTKPPSNTPVAEVGCRAYNFQCLSQENVSVKHVKKSRSISSSTTSSRSSTPSNKQDSPKQSSGVNHGQQNGQHPAPFRVKKEGGVTTLVVSKRYLEQLLSEKEMKTAKETSDKAAAVTATDILQDNNYLPALHSSSKHSSRRSRSSSNSGSRVSIWRPALESISESHNNGTASSGSHHYQQKHQVHHLHQHHHHQHQRQQQING